MRYKRKALCIARPELEDAKPVLRIFHHANPADADLKMFNRTSSSDSFETEVGGGRFRHAPDITLATTSPGSITTWFMFDALRIAPVGTLKQIYCTRIRSKIVGWSASGKGRVV